MTDTIQFRRTNVEDLETLFAFQLDEQGGFLAAFMPNNHDDKQAYINKFTLLLNNPTVTMFTIWQDSAIIGSVSKFEINSEAEVTYWIDRQHWGKGIATLALQYLLDHEKMRPITGRVAFDNMGSQKVLERCGFLRIGSDSGFASARGAEIEEFIYRLDS